MADDLTLLLNRLSTEHRVSADQLLPLVYEDLRRVAAQKMAQESSGQTLQATALVHKAWIRVGGGGHLVISFPTVTGRPYTLWRSETMAEGTWTDTGLPAVVGTGATLSFTVPASAPGHRFFRARANP